MNEKSMKAKIERLESCVRELACQLAAVEEARLAAEERIKRLHAALDEADEHCARLISEIERLTQMNDALSAM